MSLPTKELSDREPYRGPQLKEELPESFGRFPHETVEGPSDLSLDSPKTPASTWLGVVRPYVSIARIDHWFKNVFMLLGVLLAIFYEPTRVAWSSVSPLILAVLSTCLVASSNYVINELLDAPYDQKHPVKKHRPAASGLVSPALAVVEWFILGAGGVMIGYCVNANFAWASLVFWICGMAYNFPPIRTKEVPYLDVLSESLNNPIRLFLGWFALVPDRVPPLSLTLAYWMIGAFFMATKRFAEYRQIGNKQQAAMYRRSFAYYDEDRLLISMFFYATTYSLFLGIFIIRYHVELILFIPIASSFLAYYLKLGLRPDSPVQNPEKLCWEPKFITFLVVSMLFFIVLLFMQVPVLYDLFGIEQFPLSPLWILGSSTSE